ncbi:MAG: hypothetical protein ACJ8IK_25335 [Burkholderiaceae bacterium]
MRGDLAQSDQPLSAQLSRPDTLPRDVPHVPRLRAAAGDKSGKPKLSAEAVAMQQMMRGIHF